MKRAVDWHVWVIIALLVIGTIYVFYPQKKVLLCIDNTTPGQCSRNTGYLCNKTLQLIFNCTVCGCSQGRICDNDMCITSEQKTRNLIAEMQKSIVKIMQPYASGSGIILEHSDGNTVVLTNDHVIDSSPNISGVEITTSEGFSRKAQEISIAPSGMDLAVVIIKGSYGIPARINYSIMPQQGDNVFALGSPQGIQGSVSKGIVSNIKSVIVSESNFKYDIIQTDAAINPGNSGGGLFSDKGYLLGVNQFILTSSGGSEGLNFAIDISALKKLPSYKTWSAFVPLPRCNDGTLYDSCSETKGLICINGKLSEDCNRCGCPSAYPYCPRDGRCFRCAPGTIPAEDSRGHGQCVTSNG